MSITKRPGVYYTETVEYELQGTGGKIPIFIGKTGNTGTSTYKVDGTSVLKYTDYATASKPISEGGIGTYNSSGELQANPILECLKDFFTESAPINNNDMSVDYVYVIDLGDGTNYDYWINAINTSKAYTDTELEIYIEPESITTSGKTVNDFIKQATDLLKEQAVNINLKNCFYTKKDATDNELITLISANQYSRSGVIEPLLFGKTIARICCTPYYNEPGFLTYRTVEADTFTKRTPAQELLLQNAGVIFNRDEKTTTTTYPKINLCTGAQFGMNPRPADSLFHARFNADHLLELIFDVCYTQIKNNETETNLVYLQAQIDKIIDTEVNNGYMIEYNEDAQTGTYLEVVESTEDPYDLIVQGSIQPVNSTIAINVTATISNPAVISGGE